MEQSDKRDQSVKAEQNEKAYLNEMTSLNEEAYLDEKEYKKEKSHGKVIVAFLSYLNYCVPFLLIIGVFGGSFLLVNLLYHLELEPVRYAFIFSSSLLVILLFLGFISFYKKHSILEKMKKEDTLLVNMFPSTGNLIEQDYQQLIQKLYYQNMALLSDADAKRTEMMDYYTMWAHQIKVPISALDLILQTEVSAGRSEPIKQELFKIEQYVEMVLHYLRIENMSSDLLLKEYDLYDLVKQAVRKYSVLFIYKKIQLKLEELDHKVITDEKWLVFVLEQILSNAVKYTKTGSVSIYMDQTRPKTLIIEDTGIGIQAEDIPRVFDRGFTGYNGRMDKKSTGIGLYLTKEILNKLSHSIKITSQVGIGTTVAIGLDSCMIEIE